MTRNKVLDGDMTSLSLNLTIRRCVMDKSMVDGLLEELSSFDGYLKSRYEERDSLLIKLKVLEEDIELHEFFRQSVIDDMS